LESKLSSIGQPRKVLIVDDDVILVELATEFFKSMGFEVRTVQQAKYVLRETLVWNPDVVILDLMLDPPSPRMNGLDVLTELRSHPKTRNIPVIIVSVVAEEARRANLLSTVQDVFSKPVAYSKLLSRVKELVGV